MEVPFWTSCRMRVAIVSFLVCSSFYTMRINLSVAMVCMQTHSAPNWTTPVQTSSNVSHGSSVEQCEAVGTNATQGDIPGPKVPWSIVTEGTVLSSFFYGYICTNILGGYLAGRFGAKIILGVGMVLACIVTLLTPVAILYEGFEYSPVPVIIIRIILGMALGPISPSMHTLWGKWAPPLERTKLITFVYSGSVLGNIMGLSLSGVLCEQTVIADGWPSIFYIFGGYSLLVMLLWCFMVYDSPLVHPRISEAEKLYIKDNLKSTVNTKEEDHSKRSVPWLSILTSVPFWAIAVAHTVENWGDYTLMTKLPAYMNDVLKFNIQENGFMSSLPYMLMFIAVQVFGQVADCLRRRNILSTTAVRKLFQCGAFIASGICLLATSFVECDLRMLAVVMVTIASAFIAGSRVGYHVNHIDIAPRFGGELYGITNTFATIPGMVAPIVVSELTINGTREEWQIVFYIWTGVYVFGALFYGVFASGVEQSWAKHHNDNNTMDHQPFRPSYVNTEC